MTLEPASLVAGLLAGDRGALARVISILEQADDTSCDVLRHLAPHVRGRPVIGITGPPGAGKSTLLDALIKLWRARGQRVGVIAVDPSSAISKGAILGDRIRMTSALDDDGVFVRSLANRGRLGGLSPEAVRAVDAFDAAGFDRIILETVGIGQSEIDVADIADIRIVISAPGMGDDIQAIKSGHLEIADILVVTKSDRADAEQTLQQLRGAVSVRATARTQIPVVKVSALQGDGIADLLALIEDHHTASLSQSDIARRRRRAAYLLAQMTTDLVRRRVSGLDKDSEIEPLADAVLNGATSLQDAAEQVLARIAERSRA